MNNEEFINNNREEINKIDCQLLELLNQRAQLTHAIRKQKIDAEISLYDPKREQDILNRLASLNKGPLYNDDIKKIFKFIIKTMREANFE